MLAYLRALGRWGGAQSWCDLFVGATPVGAMTLATYLPTRVFELTVPTLDLAHALGLEPPSGLVR